MGWNTPPTFNPGQVISDTDLNNYLRDNPLYLLSGRPWGVNTFSSSSITFNSTVDIPLSTSLARIAITPSHVNARVLVVANVFLSAGAGGNLYMSIGVDGTVVSNTGVTGANNSNVSVCYVATLATIAGHNIDMYVHNTSAGVNSLFFPMMVAVEIA